MKFIQHRECRKRVLLNGVLVILFWIVSFSSLSSAPLTPLKKASLIPLWTPQSQFAGYYVALDKGIYARHGIDLTILKGGVGRSPSEFLQNGKADFAVLWLTTALQHRSAGLQLVHVAQIMPGSSMMLISKKSSGIRKLQDINGKRVGLWAGDLSTPPRTLFSKNRISVHEVPQSSTVNLFLRGGIDVTSAMWYNEYHVLLNSGVDADQLSVIFLQDYGMNFPEDGLYALEKTVTKDPALVNAFVDASLEGWQYAFAHPDEALDIVIKYMRQTHVSTNRIHQKWMLERMKDLILSGRGRPFIGLLRKQDYEAVGSMMKDEGLIQNYPDYATFTWRYNAGK